MGLLLLAGTPPAYCHPPPPFLSLLAYTHPHVPQCLQAQCSLGNPGHFGKHSLTDARPARHRSLNPTLTQPPTQPFQPGSTQALTRPPNQAPFCRLSEAKLGPLGESSEEDANQTEMVAQLEGDNMGLADFKVDVNSW